MHGPWIFSNYRDILYNFQKNIIFGLYFPSEITLSIFTQVDEIFNQNGFRKIQDVSIHSLGYFPIRMGFLQSDD